MSENMARIRFGGDIEVFSAGDGQPPVIRGYAAIYNTLSDDLGGFYTKIAPGAFDRVLPTSDVRLLVNHDSNLLLGRTKSGTLRLTADDRGLYFEGQPPQTDFAAHYVEAIRRGDMSGCSFSCDIPKEGSEWDESGLMPIRTIKFVSALHDVGPVTIPAFPDTSVVAYALEAFRREKSERIEAAARRGRRARSLFMMASLGL